MSDRTENGANGAAIREDWLLDICARLQHTLGQAAFEGREPDALSETLHTLPLPATRLEELVLGGLLLELTAGATGRTAAELHRQASQLAAWQPRRHSLTLAERAADHIRRNYQRPLAIRSLAAKLGCDETALRRQFQAVYRIGLRDYHVRARVQAAIRLMIEEPSKVSSIARQVGYASERNLHRNIQQLTGHTPAALRRESSGARRRLADSLVPPLLSSRWSGASTAVANS